MQQAGIEDEQVVLLLEDHQFEGTDFLELINSLLSAGEIPGLYTPEELEPALAPLRDQASDAGFRGTLAQYFASSKLQKYFRHFHCIDFWSVLLYNTFKYLLSFVEIQKNLHVVLIMDCANSKFSVNCESNPAFFKQCAVQWLDEWSRESMIRVNKIIKASNL